MKTYFVLDCVSPKNEMITMKGNLTHRVLTLTFTLLLLSFHSCREDAVLPSPSDVPTSKAIYPTDNVIIIEDSGRPSNTLETRGVIADIDDVTVARAGGSTIIGGLDSFFNKMHNRPGRISIGMRIGISDTISLNLRDNTFNDYNCYRINANDFCGYIGKDRDHALNISENGNYRIQVTPLSNTRNLDVFVYKHVLLPNGIIDSTVVASSTLPAGKTETVQLTEAGYYTIVVDEKVSTPRGSDYILAVSRNTPVVTTPILKGDGTLAYQFSLKHPVSFQLDKTLIAWSLKKKIVAPFGGRWSDLGEYPVTSTFIFTDMSADYAIAPVYKNRIYPNTITVGDGTLIRP